MIRINLVSGPRNISTALMYSFAQRSDTTVVDEPFYAVYLAKTGADHPGKEQVLASLPTREEEVRRLLKTPSGKEVLFVKNMAHHMEVLEDPYIDGSMNVFLIRDPLQIIASYSAVIEKPLMRDIGIEYQYTLFKDLQTMGEKTVVVDSGLLLDDPETVLRQLTGHCGINFEQRMLHWPKGPKSYDGVWATHWYANVHRSTGFETGMTRSRVLDKALIPLYEQAQALYEKLLPFSLKA